MSLCRCCLKTKTKEPREKSKDCLSKKVEIGRTNALYTVTSSAVEKLLKEKGDSSYVISPIVEMTRHIHTRGV